MGALKHEGVMAVGLILKSTLTLFPDQNLRIQIEDKEMPFANDLFI